MEEVNLLVVSGTAFGAVIVLLAGMAGLMRVLSAALPEKGAEKVVPRPPAQSPAQSDTAEGAREDPREERERAAAAVAVLLEMEKAERASRPVVETVPARRGWKLAGRLERM